LPKAVLLLGCLLALLVVQGLVAPWTLLIHQLPLDTEPRELQSTASRMLHTLGRGKQKHRASGLAWDLELLEEIRRRSGPDRWGDLSD
jgi:hypothetical protein